MRRDPDEVFRFLWENRDCLGLCDEAYSRVLSVRPCVRVGTDGFVLHETVAEYYQVLNLTASELTDYELCRPEGMSPSQQVRLYGGGALIFDEFGKLQFHIHNHLLDSSRQQRRLDDLWSSGFFKRGSSAFRRISALHRRRALGLPSFSHEEW